MADPAINFGKVTVSTTYDSASTSIALSSGHGARLPNPATSGAFNLVWWDSTNYQDPADDPNREIVRCTARSTDTLTIVRNHEGSGASTKNTGGATYKMILAFTKKTYDRLRPRARLNVTGESAAQYTSVLTGSGSFAASSHYLRLSTSTTDGSSALFYGTFRGDAVDAFFDKNPIMYARCELSSDPETTFQSWILMGAGNTGPGADAAFTTKHVGIILDGTTLYASNANGTTQTLTDITGSLALNDPVDFMMILDSGSSARFYANGTLVATHTTNLPSGARNNSGVYYGFGLDNDTGETTNRQMDTESAYVEWDAIT